MAVSVNNPVDLASPGPIGGTTPGSGAFTTLSATGLITATGGQIKFPASQNASADANTLDDYEEGTFTPTFTFVTPGDLSVAYNIQVGLYTKIGRICVISIDLSMSSFTFTTASGNANIVTMPFSSANLSQSDRGGCLWRGITKANFTDVAISVNGNGTTMTAAISGSGQAPAIVTAADMPSGGVPRFNGTIQYITAS